MRDDNKILAISGSGRHVGKTWLACRLLEIHGNQGIVAVKVSSHFHHHEHTGTIIFEQSNCRITHETTAGNKDSMCMVAAGASVVYYIEAEDDGLPKAWDKVCNIIDSKAPIIVESPRLYELLQNAQKVFLTQCGDAEKIVPQIHFTPGKWIINPI